jgi:hypothetical protein
MSKGEFNRRNEKDEKDLRKQEEKSAEEKWQRDPLGAVVWAAILIWGGIVLLASNLGAFDLVDDFLRDLPLFGEDIRLDFAFFPTEGWSVFFLGAAVILLIEVAIRLLVPAYRKSVVGTLILVAVFAGLATGNFLCIGPLILIGIGISILFRGFQKKE